MQAILANTDKNKGWGRIRDSDASSIVCSILQCDACRIQVARMYHDRMRIYNACSTIDEFLCKENESTETHKPLPGTPGMGSWPYSTRMAEPMR